MNLMLDSKFKVETDSSFRNYILFKLEDIKDKKTKEIKQDWVIVGHFGHSFSSLLKRYKDESLINLENTTLEEIKEKLNQIDKHIDTVVKAAKIKMVSKDDD
jgi:hypothetical protein